NSICEVFVDGKLVKRHEGGYSAFRVDLTESLKKESLLVITCDNGENEEVYPQMADFTFYGGIYRDVSIICVPESHFELEYYGTPGLKVTPAINGNDAEIDFEVYLKNQTPNQTVRYSILDKEGNLIEQKQEQESRVSFNLKNVHLWHGRKDPYLYTAKAELIDNGKVIDEVMTRFGVRSFQIDPDNGFILNGREYPLRGVSRHQDRWGKGNALSKEDHKEDMALIYELGATTVRLAHYQQDEYFYDLCDEYGLVVWAEIPYISKHMPNGRENTVSQMKELIIQNYNHPSIVVWGLSNEITMQGSDEDLLENHRILNDLAHKLDKTRLTTIACVSPCDINDPYIKIPDVVSYNHYFGWYGGDTSMNGPWFDKFHAAHPDIPIGCSEYGCEALNWHSSNPTQGDYTEEYQAYYHEELIKQLYTRKYLWATHVWNMFDFGADARNEGGENGQNHKGLVTFDRKYKKDSFYAYKAWLSDVPFVHICGKRYVERAEATTKITVYSNQKEVELFANGVSLGKKSSDVHFFYFDVPNQGETKLVAVAGDEKDESFIKKVESFNEKYRLKEKGAVLNWFDIIEPEGYFSLNDKIGDIIATPAGASLFSSIMAKLTAGKGGKDFAGFEMSQDMMSMLSGFTVLRLCSMLGMMNIELTKEQLLDMNARLNKIKKP
ncbi:MAG: glycoside hydrolase family 2 TIM barrel-domain containing protein, partial [Acutalibacteraceae bacterium]